MNKLIKEEFEFAKTHLKTIEKIVISSACSCIPPDYLEGLREINKKYHYTTCITCNSSIFMATNRLYKDYIYTKEQIKEGDKQNENKKTSRNNKRSTKEKGQKGNDRKDESITGESN